MTISISTKAQKSWNGQTEKVNYREDSHQTDRQNNVQTKCVYVNV